MSEPPQFDDAFREQLATLFAWRRDVRRFRIDAIAETDMLDLLELAQRAPSVGNSQPWRFVRVRSPELRESLAQHVDTEGARAGERYAGSAQHAAYHALKLHGLREAPEILGVFCDEGAETGAGLGLATMPEARAYSVVLAIHTLWLAARGRGIALGWVSILDAEWLARTLAVPRDWRTIALLCLGYAEEDRSIPELERQGWQARLDWRKVISER